MGRLGEPRVRVPVKPLASLLPGLLTPSYLECLWPLISCAASIQGKKTERQNVSAEVPIFLYCALYFFLLGPHVTWAGFKLAVWPRMSPFL